MAEGEFEEVSEGSKRVHCSNCGAELYYQPGTTQLVCGYCNTKNEIDVSEMAIEEHDLLEFLNQQADKDEKETHEAIACNSCGSITSFDDKTTARQCGFCGNHLLLKDAAKYTQIKPHALLPFDIDHRKAHAEFRNWLGKLWFAPSKLKRMANSPEGLQGIYIPYWTFDANTYSEYTGQRGITRHYTENYTVNVNGRTETRSRTKSTTDWYPASGDVDHFFDDTLILGSESLPKEKAEKLSPWDLNNLVHFKEDYLRGFKVENYRVELDVAFKEGKERMEDEIRSLVRQDIGGDQQRISSLHTDWKELKFKHILLPIYIASYPFKGKTYRFLVNGRTGEVQGERPWSAGKIALLVIVILVVIGLIIIFSQ